MGSLGEHESHSREVLGRPWTEVHVWLDQYSDLVRGPAHRIVLHHHLGVALGVAKFSEEARAALELHIIDDLGVRPEGPEDVATLVAGQDIASLIDAMETLQSVLNEIWPGRAGVPCEELVIMRLRGK